MSKALHPAPSDSPLTVLLVEDNRINQAVAMRQLERLGHRVELAADGVQGVARAAEGGLDLVLMDIQMPQMDGIAATRAIRAAEASTGRPRIPIIAMTAQTLTGDRQQCLDSGMDGYIGKPVTADELAAELSRVLASRSGCAPPVAGDTPAPVPAGDDPWVEIDLADLRERFEGDSGLLADLVELARPDWLIIGDALQAAARQRDVPELRRRAHALVGMAGNVAAVTVVALARRLGPAAVRGNWQEVDATLAEISPRLEWLSRWTAPDLSAAP